jgi:hypothetical protein
MSIIMDENIVGIWFVAGEYEGQSQDWMGGLRYEERDGKRTLVFTYRFRYYTDKPTGDPFKDDDRKSWYSVVAKDNENESLDVFLATIRGMVRLTQEHLGAESYEEILQKDFVSYKAFLDYFVDRPWAYCKSSSKEEMEEMLEEIKQGEK